MLIFASIVVGIMVIFSPVFFTKIRPRTFILLVFLWLVLMGVAYYAGGK